jgi:hypothetical protein
VGGQLHSPAGITSRENYTVPMVQEAGWAPGPVWTGTNYLTLTRIRSLDRPVLSESLYRLSYPGRHRKANIEVKVVPRVRHTRIWPSGGSYASALDGCE